MAAVILAPQRNACADFFHFVQIAPEKEMADLSAKEREARTAAAFARAGAAHARVDTSRHRTILLSNDFAWQRVPVGL